MPTLTTIETGATRDRAIGAGRMGSELRCGAKPCAAPTSSATTRQRSIVGSAEHAKKLKAGGYQSAAHPLVLAPVVGRPAHIFPGAMLRASACDDALDLCRRADAVCCMGRRRPATRLASGDTLGSDGLVDPTPIERAKAALAHYNRGCELQELGQLRAAIDQYRHAIDLDPPDGAWIEQSLQSVFVDACYNLGRAYQEVGDLGGAAAQYELVLARHPTHPLTHYNLGHVKHQQGDGAAAKECFEIAIELAPTDVDAQVSLGNVQREMGARAAAIAAYTAALELEPRNGLALYNLGTTHHDAGDLDAAASCFERALEAEPTHADSAFALGLVHQDNHRMREALRYFELALELDPDFDQVPL